MWLFPAMIIDCVNGHDWLACMNTNLIHFIILRIPYTIILKIKCMTCLKNIYYYKVFHGNWNIIIMNLKYGFVQPIHMCVIMDTTCTFIRMLMYKINEFYIFLFLHHLSPFTESTHFLDHWYCISTIATIFSHDAM